MENDDNSSSMIKFRSVPRCSAVQQSDASPTYTEVFSLIVLVACCAPHIQTCEVVTSNQALHHNFGTNIHRNFLPTCAILKIFG